MGEESAGSLFEELHEHARRAKVALDGYSADELTEVAYLKVAWKGTKL